MEYAESDAYAQLREYEYIDAWTTRDGIVYLIRRDGDRKIIVRLENIKSYFFIKEADFTQFYDEVKAIAQNYRLDFEHGQQWVKVYYEYTWQEAISQVFDAKNITTYEMDVQPHRRLFINEGLKISGKQRILFFDIETDDRIGDIEIGRDRLISIAACDLDGKTYFYCDDDEYKILSAFRELVEEYDIISGWNSERFDYPYLEARFARHNIRFWRHTVLHIDYVELFKKNYDTGELIGKIGSLKLDDVGAYVLGHGKYEFARSEAEKGYGGRLWKLFTGDRAELKKYNVQDCQILAELEQKYNLLQSQVAIASISQIPADRTQSVGAVIDQLVLRYANTRDMHFRSVWVKDDLDLNAFLKQVDLSGVPEPDKAREKLERGELRGGYVYEVKPGVYDTVSIFDFKSLYPSIIRTFNISPDSIIRDQDYKGEYIETPIGTKFKPERGLFAEINDMLQTERDIYNDMSVIEPIKEKPISEIAHILSYTEDRVAKTLEQLKAHAAEGDSELTSAERVAKYHVMQAAVKVIGVSMFGVLGSTKLRYFALDCASSITLNGQWFMNFAGLEAEKLGHKMLYGDTDSVMIALKSQEDAIPLEKHLNKLFAEYCDGKNLCQKAYMRLVLERVTTRMIFLSKKRYVGHVIWKKGEAKDNIYSKGAEMKRADYTKFAKAFQAQVMNDLLRERKGIDHFRKLVMEKKNALMNHEVPAEDLVIVQQVAKMLDDYASKPLHVKIAERYKAKTGVFYVSIRIPYIITRSNPLDGEHFEMYSGSYDAGYYWKNKVYPAIQRVLEIAFPAFDWGAYGGSSSGFQSILADY